MTSGIKQNMLPGAPERKPRLLWANVYCLLDTSSGASLSVREMLRQLAFRGWEIAILGATVFDHKDGMRGLSAHWERIAEKKVVHLFDDPLQHELLVVSSTLRDDMSCREESRWLSLYVRKLETFRPDMVWYYGGQPLDLLIADEASSRGIPVAAYLANGSYRGTRWCRDVDVIVTDSVATAAYYRKNHGIEPIPVGKFIDPARVIAKEHSRRNLLFINPLLQKGVGIVIQLALLLGKRRPDIIIEVVESRGNWHAFVEKITARLGDPHDRLDNVLVTAHTTDMCPVYGRARLLLAPSLWWESGPRVAVEAMLNGIPAIVSNCGGIAEMIGNAGIRFDVPDACHKKPFVTLPGMDLLEPVVDRIIRLYDDEELYAVFVSRAFEVARTKHSMEISVRRLMDAFDPLLLKMQGGL